MAMLVASSLLNADGVVRSGADDRVANVTVACGNEIARKLAADKFDERFHLRLHLSHFVAHIENDFDAREVDAQFARQVEDHFEPLEVFVRVKTRIALRTRRLQQADALVEAQRLRMKLVKLSDGAD